MPAGAMGCSGASHRQTRLQGARGSTSPAKGCPAFVGGVGTYRGLLGCHGTGRHSHGGTTGRCGPDTCQVGSLPGLDTVINVLMAAKPLCKRALISDTGGSASTCERACGLGAAAPQSSVDTAPD